MDLIPTCPYCCTLWPRPACQEGHGRTSSPPHSSILEFTSSSRKPSSIAQPTLCSLLTHCIDRLPAPPIRVIIEFIGHINSGSEMTLMPQGLSHIYLHTEDFKCSRPDSSSPVLLCPWWTGESSESFGEGGPRVQTYMRHQTFLSFWTSGPTLRG